MSRLDQVNSLLHSLISQFLEKQRDEFIPAFITVKQVQSAKDLKTAKVWIAVLQNNLAEQTILKKLEFLRGELQTYIGSRITFKFNPKLIFLIDHSGENAQRIDEVINRIKRKRNKK